MYSHSRREAPIKYMSTVRLRVTEIAARGDEFLYTLEHFFDESGMEG
jgi:hypothetical protein